VTVALRALAAALAVAMALAVLLFWPSRAPFSSYRPVLDAVLADAPGPNRSAPKRVEAAGPESTPDRFTQ
jgi:hypothetical protein